MVVKVVRSGYFVHHRTVGTFVLNHTDVPSSGGETAFLLSDLASVLNSFLLVLTTSLFSRDGGEIGTVTYSLGVSHSNPLAHTADSDKALDKMVLGPIIAAPLPGYEPVVGAIMSQASAWDVLATRLQRLEGVIRVVDELSQVRRSFLTKDYESNVCQRVFLFPDSSMGLPGLGCLFSRL